MFFLDDHDLRVETIEQRRRDGVPEERLYESDPPRRRVALDSDIFEDYMLPTILINIIMYVVKDSILTT